MSSFYLKIIAIIAMTIDHVENIIGQWRLFPNMPSSLSYTIINIMDGIGRIAFPLFAFMITEGVQKTRSMPRYIGRLALFALISEPFFYFSHWRNSPTIGGFFQGILDLNWGNVFFTLTLSAIAIYVYQLLERKQLKRAWLLFIPIGAVITFTGGYLGCDYGVVGILLIIFLFFAKTRKQKCLVIVLWSICVYGFGQAYNPIRFVLVDCIFAALSSAFVWCYNGKRGKQLKWTFYIYYPVHLLVLTVIQYVMR